MSFLKNMKINGRLTLGFAIVVLVLVGAVGSTVWKVDGIKGTTDRIVNLRTPTAQASAAMVNNINASLAALRGWMITGNTSFKTERTAVWANVDAVRKAMDDLSANWTNPKNVEVWTELKTVLDEFQKAQERVEAIAHTADEQPATKILIEQAAPRAAVVVAEITRMIDEEQTLDASAERKALLGMMADVRGTMGLALANIRAYLLTGGSKFAANFKKLWAKNERRFNDLSENGSLMSATQKEAFAKLTKARTEFAPLPAKMFEVRGSKKWNMANYLLVTEAAPRAGKLLTVLLGAKTDDGSRAGGMVDNQKLLLTKDAVANASETDQLLTMQWVLLVLGVAIASIIAFFTSRSIVNPITKMTAAMTELAGGDVETEIPALDKKDEIGEMASAVQVFKDNAIEKIRLEKEQVEAEKRAEEEKRATMNKMADDFDNQVGGIVDTVSSAATEMRSTAESMSSTAEETSHQSSAVAAAAEQASANVQTVASAAEELANSVQEIGRQVAKSNEIATNAVDEIGRTNKQVQGLAEAAQKIGEVVDLISDIADQTNLLALNATIEAARAGDAGKGFAVVASEVKGLATQTAKATGDISEQITSIQTATQEAVAAIGGIGSTIGKISEIVSTVAAAVEEQGSATQEIARNTEEAAKGTQEVTSNIGGVTEAATATGAASGQVLQSAGQLSEQSELLRKEVETFMATVRAA